MSEPFRITQPLLDVLEVLLEALRNGAEVHGWAIMRETRRTGPTVYGVLDRLESIGWVTARWELVPDEANRPRRRLYQITAAGSSAASALLAERRPGRSKTDGSASLPPLSGRSRRRPNLGHGAT